MADSQLDILVCPHCRQAILVVLDDQSGILCPHCRLVYPVRDDIPFVCSEEAIAAGAWLMGVRGLSRADTVYRAAGPAAEHSANRRREVFQ